MLTDINSWELIVNSMGISNEDEIVIYDNSDVISSCRCWYNLIYFGHDPKLVHVLDGGLNKWKIENKITNSNSGEDLQRSLETREEQETNFRNFANQYSSRSLKPLCWCCGLLKLQL